MKYIYYKITLLLLLLFTLSAPVEANYQKHYQKWMGMSSEQLLTRGEKFLRVENKIDSALVCFSIVYNRYNSGISNEEKLNCCKAEYGKWYIYFAKIFDYTKAYECLLNAKGVLDESQIEYPEINLGFAVFCHTLASQSYDKSLEKKALQYCTDGFWQVYKQKDYNLINVFFCNILLVAQELDCIQTLDKEWQAYNSLRQDDNFTYQFNILQYMARLKKSQKNYIEARKYVDDLVDLSINNGEDIRRTNIAYFLKARILYQQEDYKGAIDILKTAEKILIKNDIRDSRLEIYEFLSRCYVKLNDAANSNKFGNRYYLLKDSILNLKQMTNVSKMAFVNEIKKMDNEISEMKYKRKSEIIFVILSAVFSLILLFFVIMLYFKNRQLKDKNRKLYENNIEMMNSEDIEIKNITGGTPRIVNIVNKEKDEEDELEEDIEDDTDDDSESEKYKNSSLSDEDKKELLAKILSVMDNVDEICSLSFSGERLAQLTDSKYKYVSQVINEKYGCNFNMFLNKFRIKEACRRFADVDKYGQYTIDAMSQSLGFKSRTTFTSSFKKIIGLTPSQYSKLAKEDKEKALFIWSK